MRGVGTIIDAANRAQYRLHVLLISMDDISPKLEEHGVLGSRSTLDRDFAPWTDDAIARMLQRTGTTLATALQSDPDGALSFAAQIRDAAGADLRLITVIGQRMNTALESAFPGARIDLTTLAFACLQQHREASERRQARTAQFLARRRGKRKAA